MPYYYSGSFFPNILFKQATRDWVDHAEHLAGNIRGAEIDGTNLFTSGYAQGKAFFKAPSQSKQRTRSGRGEGSTVIDYGEVKGEWEHIVALVEEYIYVPFQSWRNELHEVKHALHEVAAHFMKWIISLLRSAPFQKRYSSHKVIKVQYT